MILTFHIVAALASFIVSGMNAFRPSAKLFHLILGSIGLTLASGAGLILVNHASVQHVCASGSLYLIAIGVMAFIAHRRAQAHFSR